MTVFTLHYFIMQVDEMITVPKKLFDKMNHMLEQLQEEVIELKLDAWENDFNKSRVNTLEEIIHEQKVEQEHLESKIYSLQGDIEYRDNQIQDLQNQLDQQYDKVENLQIALAQESTNSLQNIISERLSIQDNLFSEKWVNRLQNLLNEIEIQI